MYYNGKENNMRRSKTIAVLLILTLSFYFMAPDRKAEAVIPLAIPPAAYYCLAAIMVGAGLTFSDRESLDYMVKECWADISQATQQKLAEITLVGGVLYHLVADQEWFEIRDWCQDNAVRGANSITTTGGTVTGTFTTLKGTKYYIGAEYHNLTTGVTASWSTAYEGEDLYLSIWKNGSLAKHVVLQEGTTNYNPYMEVLFYSTWQTGGCKVMYNNTGYMIEDEVSSACQIVIDGIVPVLFNGEAVIENDAWDWTNEDSQDRRIPAPPGILGETGVDPSICADTAVDNLINKTYQDVIIGNIGNAIPGDITTETGLLSNVWGALNQIYAQVLAIGTALTSFFDLSKPIDWQPLRMTGVEMTTIFPFSLPWDLKRMVENFSGGTGFEPILDMSIPIVNQTYDIHIDFGFMQPIVSIVRTVELVLFNIGLILATRRLLGGDA